MLHDVLRGEWNWTGYILSDAGATAFVGKTQIGTPGSQWHESNKSFGHGFASSQQDAAVKALSAGLDLELTCCGVYSFLLLLLLLLFLLFSRFFVLRF